MKNRTNGAQAGSAGKGSKSKPSHEGSLEGEFTGFAEAPQEPFDTSDAKTGGARMRMILDTARGAGLLEQKTARISGRISPALLDRAKRLTGIDSDTDLIEFALASIALDDPFPEAFRQARGKVDPDLKLGF